MKFEDLTGQYINGLYIVGRAEDRILPSGQAKTQWICRCECGNHITLLRTRLLRGVTTSCGCKPKQTEELPIPEKRTAESCIYNRHVLCADFDCTRCSWNPENKELRQKRLKKIEERMRSK